MSRSVKRIRMTLVVRVGQQDIDEGECRLATRCMLKVALERHLRSISGASDHHVRVDAGHMTFTYEGYRWRGDTSRQAKAALIAFDREDKERKKAQRTGTTVASKVKPFTFKLEAWRGGKLELATEERKKQINNARNKRRQEGRPDRSYTLHQRVVGFA